MQDAENLQKHDCNSYLFSSMAFGTTLSQQYFQTLAAGSPLPLVTCHDFFQGNLSRHISLCRHSGRYRNASWLLPLVDCSTDFSHSDEISL